MSTPITFSLTPVEQARVEKWWKTIVALYFEPDADNECFYYPGSITYSFTPTGISPVVWVEDSYSKERLNVTDYGSW